MNNVIIAQICHEANRVFCQSIGDTSQVHWEEAPEWQRTSAIKGVNFRMDNLNAPISTQHESWFQEKENDGWVYGQVKDAEKKTHPCMVPYDQLPLEQKMKDHLFANLVDCLKNL